jgi:hypothetical protein
MKYSVKILNVSTVNELESYWSDADRKQLLEAFDFNDFKNAQPGELHELLLMAITDYEADEAASILLDYKLGKVLNEGQIQSLSHEMMADKIAEEYPDPALHFDLFNINQLLYKAYNGKFPNTEATVLELELKSVDNETTQTDKEVFTKILSQGLSDENIINRLYPEQVAGKAAFEDANKIIWQINDKGDGIYEITTSKYWISKEDVVKVEYEASITFFEEENEN